MGVLPNMNTSDTKT